MPHWPSPEAVQVSDSGRASIITYTIWGVPHYTYRNNGHQNPIAIIKPPTLSDLKQLVMANPKHTHMGSSLH